MKEKYRLAQNWALDHGGVVTRPVLDALGFTTAEIDGRVRRHGWVGVGRGAAYRVVAPRDHLDAVRAATTVLGNSVVSHETAAELHQMPFVPTGQAAITVHSRTTYRYPGVVVHRTHDLADSHVTVMDGLRATTLERTVVDLAQTRTIRHVGSIVDDLVARRCLDIVTLGHVVESVGRRGKPGTSVMRAVLDARVGQQRSQSELERRARGLLLSTGLPEPEHEFPIPWAPHRRFDDAYPASMLAIEWDSRRYHGQLDAFDADRRRDREAIVRGWRILRFTWRDVTETPDVVIETIRAVL